MTEFYLVPIAFLTSCLTAIMGLGGGVLLIATMPGLMPTAAIIPVHACTQLASNLSRAAFGWRDIDWGIVPAIALGALLGAWLGSEIYASLDLRWLPALMGCVILVFTWLPLPVMRGGGQGSLFLLGFYQTGIGMLAGATGPLGAAVLQRRKQQRDWLVVNTAAYMCINHFLRTFAFVLLGFSFAPWWSLLTGLVLAVVAGSWVGTRIRPRVPQLNFERWFRVVVTLLALRMITLSYFDLVQA